MANDTNITFCGNLTADPELRFTQSGLPVVNFSVASTPRSFDKQTGGWKDGTTTFMRCSAWREMAEHIAATLSKGAGVVLVGRLVSNNWTDKERQSRTSLEIEVDDIGPSLKFATAQVTRVPRDNNGQGQAQQRSQQQARPPQKQQQNQQQAQPQQGGGFSDDPWGNSGYVDEPPF